MSAELHRIILNVTRAGQALGVRAAFHLIDHPEKEDALLQYGDTNNPPTFWVRRGKGSVIVWEQPTLANQKVPA